jgi:hypothetical protein
MNISTNQIDSYILVVGEANARQLSPQTTRTVVQNYWDRMLRQLGPY